jgi:Tat protein translocase TatB subunit
MFEVGFMEIVLVSVIGLLVLGPQRLPKVAAEIGKWIGRARRTATQLRRQLEREIELSELQTPLQPPSAPPPPPAPNVPRSGEVPPGPGTHADLPDSAAGSANDEPALHAAAGSPESQTVAGGGSSGERFEGDTTKD